MERILVLRGGALGDSIVTFPALAAMRSRWPTARIELVGNAMAARLALKSGLLDAVHSQNESRWAALYSNASLPAGFATWLASFDLVVNFWADRDGELARHFPRQPAQQFLSASAQPSMGPAAAHFCAPLQSLGLSVPAEKLYYQFPPALRRNVTADPSQKRRVAIHPGSGSPAKNWSIDRWLELADWLEGTVGAELLVITGEAESFATRDALAGIETTAHSLPLDELVAAISGCQLFVGHDSGVSHLAAACGVPSVLLFGPTDPAIWAPPAPHVHVLRRASALSAIAVADVQAAITPLLAEKK